MHNEMTTDSDPKIGGDWAPKRDGEGRFAPGSGGRPKGVPNKETRGLRQTFLATLEELGGQAWLVDFARAQPFAFFGALARMLPKEIAVKAERKSLEDVTGLSREELERVLYADCVCGRAGRGKAENRS